MVLNISTYWIIMVDIKDKDPFANTGAKPKDNVTLGNEIIRYWFRSSGMIVWIPIYLIFVVIFGIQEQQHQSLPS